MQVAVTLLESTAARAPAQLHHHTSNPQQLSTWQQFPAWEDFSSFFIAAGLRGIQSLFCLNKPLLSRAAMLGKAVWTMLHALRMEASGGYLSWGIRAGTVQRFVVASESWIGAFPYSATVMGSNRLD